MAKPAGDHEPPLNFKVIKTIYSSKILIIPYVYILLIPPIQALGIYIISLASILIELYIPFLFDADMGLEGLHPLRRLQEESQESPSDHRR